MLAERFTPDSMVDASGRLGTMNAEAAHEITNLMTVVLGSLEQLRRQPLDEPGQRQLARAEWGARHVAQLTRRVLYQAQERNDTAEAVDLNAAVDGFVRIMENRANEGARVTAELAPGPLPVRLDAGLLDLVLLNLVRNATDALPNGGEVVVHTRRPRLDGMGEQLTVEVSVSDNGTGMPPGVAQRATEAFFTTKPNGKGTGLGLWMAHSFASECGGTVKIETASGRGTTVRLVFPYAGEAAPG